MKRTQIIVLGATSLGLGALSTLPISAATNPTTTIQATVGKIVECSQASSTVDMGTMNPGQMASKVFTIGAKTNSTAGFTITSSEINDLEHTSTSDKIPYDTSVSAGGSGYKMVPATSSEWTQGGVTIPSGGAISQGAVWSHNAYSGSENITVTVGVSESTPSGTYSGSVFWICGVQ